MRTIDNGSENTSVINHQIPRPSRSYYARLDDLYRNTRGLQCMYIYVFGKADSRIVYTMRELKRKISICGRYAVTESLNRTVLAVSLTLQNRYLPM